MFTSRDYFSLFLLSLRSFFWRVDGKQNIKGLLKIGSTLGVLLLLYLILAALLYPIGTVFFGLQSIVYLVTLQFSEAFELFEAVIGGIIHTIAVYLLVFNMRRLNYALHCRKTAWYQNTGYKPSKVTSDVGLYGEYIVTMCAEANLKKMVSKAMCSIV